MVVKAIKNSSGYPCALKQYRYARLNCAILVSLKCSGSEGGTAVMLRLADPGASVAVRDKNNGVGTSAREPL